jgi:hypothetical protein
MGKMIGLIIVWVVGIAIFLGLLMWGVTERWGKGGHPVVYGGILAIICLAISLAWSKHKGGDDSKEEIKDNY